MVKYFIIGLLGLACTESKLNGKKYSSEVIQKTKNLAKKACATDYECEVIICGRTICAVKDIKPPYTFRKLVCSSEKCIKERLR